MGDISNSLIALVDGQSKTSSEGFAVETFIEDKYYVVRNGDKKYHFIKDIKDKPYVIWMPIKGIAISNMHIESNYIPQTKEELELILTFGE